MQNGINTRGLLERGIVIGVTYDPRAGTSKVDLDNGRTYTVFGGRDLKRGEDIEIKVDATYQTFQRRVK